MTQEKTYKVHRYLYKNSMQKCYRKFSEFKNPKLLKVSNGYYQFLDENNTVFTATIELK